MTVKKRDVMNHDPLADLETADAEVGVMAEDEIQQSLNEGSAASTGYAPVEQADDRELKLDSCLTIAEVGALAEQLVGMFDSGGNLALDGSEIEQIDGAGIQMLAGLMKEAAAQQAEVSWTGTTAVLREAAAQLGLAQLLHLEQAT